MNKKITVLFLLITSFTFGQNKEVYTKIGDSLISQGKIKESIRYFEAEYQKYPKNEAVLRWLGYSYFANNDLNESENYYNKAIAVNPKCARCYVNIGKVYSMRNENEKAFEFFERAIEIDVNDASLYSDRAKLKEMNGNNLGALRDHNKALEMEPNCADCHYYRGLFNANSGLQDLAIIDFTKAIQLSSANFYTYFQRALVYTKQNRIEEALSDLNTAIGIDKNQSILFLTRGTIFSQLLEKEKALMDFSTAISLNKNNFEAYLKRATLYYEIEDLEASCTDYQTLKSFVETGKLKDEAFIKHINNTIQDYCDLSIPSYYYQRGIGLYNLKEYQKAVEIYHTGLVKFPENAMLLSFKGNAHMFLNEFEKSIELYQLSLKNKESFLNEIKINPRFADASEKEQRIYYSGYLASTYYSLAESNAYLNHFDEALNAINNAIELLPELKDLEMENYYNLRGHIYTMKNQYAKAIIDFDKALQINKNFATAYVNRAIAKTNSADNIKIQSISIGGNIKNQPIYINWVLPKNASLKKYEVKLQSVLNDCDMAINLDKNYGFGYYIRGQIKQLLRVEDYCLDILKAQELGIIVDDVLLDSCK